MRLNEIASNTELTQLAEACEQWIELWNIDEATSYILSHPLSKKFQTTPAVELYRSVFYDYKQFLENTTIKIKPQTNGFVAYSSGPNWGRTARSDFDYNGDVIKFKKENKGIVLNFSALVHTLNNSGHSINVPDEGEIWVPANEYYTTFNKSHYVNVDLA